MDALDLIRQGKIHRYFRATRKLNAPNLVSHITQRAAGREPLFMEVDDYLYFLKLLKDIARKSALTVYAFCLMPNHIHTLLRPTESNLQDVMRDLFSRHAMRFNRKYERKGHLFGGPYRQSVCLDDSYLLAVSLYIHLNPARAGLVQGPLDYRWSSCQLYCDKSAPRSFVDPGFVLSLLNDHEAASRDSYGDLLRKGGALDMAEVLEQEDAIERFRTHIASIVPSLFRWLAKTQQVARTSGIDLLTIEELESQAEAVTKRLYPGKPETIRAKKYLIEQLFARGYRGAEIADKLGISRKTVYNILKS
jgi:putative transposase